MPGMPRMTFIRFTPTRRAKLPYISTCPIGVSALGRATSETGGFASIEVLVGSTRSEPSMPST